MNELAPNDPNWRPQGFVAGNRFMLPREDLKVLLPLVKTFCNKEENLTIVQITDSQVGFSLNTHSTHQQLTNPLHSIIALCELWISQRLTFQQIVQCRGEGEASTSIRINARVLFFDIFKGAMIVSFYPQGPFLTLSTIRKPISRMMKQFRAENAPVFP